MVSTQRPHLSAINLQRKLSSVVLSENVSKANVDLQIKKEVVFMDKTKFIMDLREFNFGHIDKHINDYEQTLYISTYNLYLDDGLIDFILKFKKAVIVLNPVPFAQQLERIEENPAKNITNNFFLLLSMGKVEIFFNRFLHAKIVGTREAVYVGSSNFSYHSKNNIEAGFVSTETEQNGIILSSLQHNVLDGSLSLDNFIASSNYSAGTNDIQRVIDRVVPMYKSLNECVTDFKKTLNQAHPERPKRCIQHIVMVREMLLTISKYLSSRFDHDKLNVEELLISSHWMSVLYSSEEKINKYVKESNALQNMATEDDLYDQLTLEDYERFYGKGVTDDYIANSNALQKALENFSVINEELSIETEKLKRYLYALSKLGKHYRAYLKR